MRYGKFLVPKDTIGVVAPSFGITIDPYLTRYLDAKQNFINKDYQISEAESIYNLSHARSNTAIIRADEFMKMWFDDNIDFIFSAAGGELMCEILPFIDFEKLKNSKPKFFMGYSDNTCLTFLLTTICDIASIYGYNITGFGMENWDISIQESYEIITGKRLNQKSYDKYQIIEPSNEDDNPLSAFNKTEPVDYQTLDNQDVNVTGRLIGGCLDILMLFCGTKFDHVAEFTKKYQDDGIIWYLEACDMNPLMLTRALWQLNQIGWFNGCKAIIFGRPMHDKEVLFDVTFTEAIKTTLRDLNIPIVMGMDFGHLPPSFTIINGCIATVKVKDHQGTISYELK